MSAGKFCVLIADGLDGHRPLPAFAHPGNLRTIFNFLELMVDIV
jgi:hypothetical protein